jgi:hypothetical protein
MKHNKPEKNDSIVADPALYQRIIENYFTTKIQRLAAVPAEPPFLYLSEMGLIHDWHTKQIPLEVVFLAIDKAFDRPGDAPISLQDCEKLVEHEYIEWLKKN